MALFQKYTQQLLTLEGGYTHHPADRGGATNMGITLENWKRYGNDKNKDGRIDENDLRQMTKEEALAIYKAQYWDALGADKIASQSVADILVDFAINSGVTRAAKLVQLILNRHFLKTLQVDGKVGALTLNAINSVSPKSLFGFIKEYRTHYYLYITNSDIASIPPPVVDSFRNQLNAYPSDSQKVFVNGWMNRIRSFVFSAQGISLGAVMLVLALFFLWTSSSKTTL